MEEGSVGARVEVAREGTAEMRGALVVDEARREDGSETAVELPREESPGGVGRGVLQMGEEKQAGWSVFEIQDGGKNHK